jgi:pimeloyl-ACP methyl ester carboxylesterase
MGKDIHELYTKGLGKKTAIVLGIDIGSMVGTALALRYREDVEALITGGECLTSRGWLYSGVQISFTAASLRRTRREAEGGGRRSRSEGHKGQPLSLTRYNPQQERSPSNLAFDMSNARESTDAQNALSPVQAFTTSR